MSIRDELKKIDAAVNAIEESLENEVTVSRTDLVAVREAFEDLRVEITELTEGLSDAEYIEAMFDVFSEALAKIT